MKWSNGMIVIAVLSACGGSQKPAERKWNHGVGAHSKSANMIFDSVPEPGTSSA